jgi:ribosomal-protein-alanine N-acetyltransferase
MCRVGDKLASLELREGNEAAMRLYSSAGFRQVGRRCNYYENGDAAILMAKAM